MLSGWKSAFSKDSLEWKGEQSFADLVLIRTLPELKVFLDSVHIKLCLIKPYFETGDYPLVEPG